MGDNGLVGQGRRILCYTELPTQPAIQEVIGAYNFHINKTETAMPDMFFTEEDLLNQRIHHEAEIMSIKAEHDAVLEWMSKYVDLANHALAKNKPHVVQYQLDRMRDLLGSE